MISETLMKDSLESMGRVCQADRGYLCLFPGEGQKGLVRGWSGEEGTSGERLVGRCPEYGTCPEYCIRSGRCAPLHAPDLRELPPGVVREEKADDRGLRSFMCVPIAMEDGFAGCLALAASEERKKCWTCEHMSLLRSVAGFLAFSIARERSEQRLEDLAYHDKLTGLFNRAFFEAELERLNVQRQHPVSIIMADVNKLKVTNDVLGHRHGDALLVNASGILSRSCRQEDILVRWGGDEFVILLPRTGRDVARDIAGRIKRGCDESCRDESPRVSLAVGWAVKEDTAKPFGRVINEAEIKMYADKWKAGQRKPLIAGPPSGGREVRTGLEF